MGKMCIRDRSEIMGEKDNFGLMNIQKRLKSQMGAEVKIESAPGKGTRATVTIPRDFLGGGIFIKTILVDDELWAMDKFEIEAAAIPDIEIVGKFDRSDEALRFAEKNRVDFALLDVEMPGMNGLELGLSLIHI